MNRVLEIESQLDSGNVAGAKDDVQVLKEDLEKSGCQIDDRLYDLGLVGEEA
jgi:hypothetical protein